MTAFTFLLALAGAAAFYGVVRRIAILEDQVRRVESLLARFEQSGAVSPPIVPESPVVPIAATPATRVEAEPRAIRTAPAPRSPVNLESLIGGRLPIWIGGAALVLAGVFLVRYSIESGLLGPATRTVLAALFGIALIAASEAARRLPATSDDPRIAQVLAGAGVASLYGTLYMAAALYHLIAPLTAFAAVTLVTGAAMALSLRHGPPTALMALIGGFAAPLVAGFDAAGIGPLLVYLALFTTALFGLAVHRGWGWLALAASVIGFAWINFLLVALRGHPGDLLAVGVFTMLLAAAASAALPATGIANRWLRIAPLIAGLVQLLALAPALDFSGLAWSLYLILAAAALVLSWRQAVYLPGALAALALLLVLESLALLQPERSATPIAAAIATLLFALSGHAFATRRAPWPMLALGGTAGPLLVAHACAPSLLSPIAWGALELAASAGCANLAWRLRSETDSPPLTAAGALAGLLAALGLAQFFPDAWLAIPLTLVLVALAGWARIARAPTLFVLPVLPLIAAFLAAAQPIAALFDLIFGSIAGDRLPYLLLPDLGTLLRTLAFPITAALLLLFDPRQFGRARRVAGAAAITVGILLVYALAKQPLAIATLPRFVELGFVERALLTQACLATGWFLLRKRRLQSLGGVLLMLGLCRFVWFDCTLLNPAWSGQQVGSIPLLNAAVFHAGLAAFWLWTLTPRRPVRIGAALLTLVAALAAVRQAAHGSLLTGPIGTAENGGYSAVLLVIALFWLWRGIATTAHDLRIAGLALLTLVTFKVFLIDAAALDGVLRILSFLALGIALIGIGWAYGRFVGTPATEPPSEA